MSTELMRPAFKLAVLQSGGPAWDPSGPGAAPPAGWRWVPIPSDTLEDVQKIAYQISDKKLTLGYRIMQLKIDADTGDVHTNIVEQWLKDEEAA